MKKPILLILAGLALIVLLQDFIKNKNEAQTIAPRPYVVMLSLDGFRWDYQDKADTPTLDSITRNGVKATGLQPVFPSKTFPNHYSIATGLYAGNHGLISNSFYDPKQKKEYSIRDRKAVENGKFYKGEPIWVTAEAQRLKTGSYFWVGSEAKIKGYQPSYWKRYDHHFPFIQRADSVIAWLKKPYNERPKLITWYIAETDDIGHKYGPNSTKIISTITTLDSIVGYFLNEVSKLEIGDSVNFILVSDHGMAPIDTQKVVKLNTYLKKSWIEKYFGGNPFVLIHPNKACADSILNALNGIEGIIPMRKNDIPERYQLKQSNRIPEIVIVADTGWSIEINPKRKVYAGGTHGYDNSFTDMQGIFYAIGPNFKQNYNAGSLYNIDIYNLIATILELKPAPNDGKKERIIHVLNNSNSKNNELKSN